MTDEFKSIGDIMKEEIINDICELCTELGFKSIEPINNGVKRFKVKEDFKIEIGECTIFFDNGNDKVTYIELDKDCIAFRSQYKFYQTTFIIFDYEEFETIDFEVDDEFGSSIYSVGKAMVKSRHTHWN